MKISKLILAFAIVFVVACSNNTSESDHGHDHSSEEAHGHSHDAGEEAHHHEQEEFTIEGDSTKMLADSTHHSHEAGTPPHKH